MGTTLKEFLRSSELKIDESLKSIIVSIAKGSVIVQSKLSRIGVDGTAGATGAINVQGEEVQNLDEEANNIFIDAFKKNGKVAIVGSEETENGIVLNQEFGEYLINMDPLDGSSNIDVAVSVGSIFGIWRRKDNVCLNDNSLLLKGREQVAAVYVVYGSSTLMVVATDSGVQSYSLDLDRKEFIITDDNLQLPNTSKYFSVNYGNWDNFSAKTQEIISDLQSKLSLRYIGSLIADFHRNLLKGGVFIYPADIKSPNGKLRLMYEANPLAFVIQKAGGIGISGKKNILDICPESLHQRTPLILGNTDIVENMFE
ncbi:MAG: fructose-bisphosphatase class I [Chloroflexi bacterium]|nr:fructose-bisphosphatase class I [Chloroflexota bacterium]|tara:strand:- start:38357 stop:39295 length:939 start_codon:yes stop_codon:yes gene_type:complete